MPAANTHRIVFLEHGTITKSAILHQDYIFPETTALIFWASFDSDKPVRIVLYKPFAGLTKEDLVEGRKINVIGKKLILIDSSLVVEADLVQVKKGPRILGLEGASDAYNS